MLGHWLNRVCMRVVCVNHVDDVFSCFIDVSRCDVVCGGEIVYVIGCLFERCVGVSVPQLVEFY